MISSSPTSNEKKHLPYLWLALLLSAGLKVILLAVDAIPFNADEAIVALMARHINQGSFPAFFYGQAYMGSLDAWLVALGFRLFGEQIWVIRLVQILLHLGYLATTWLLVRRFFADAKMAVFTVLVMSIPPVLITTYTTATLGGYGETLLLGNVILYFGYEVTFGAWGGKWWAWVVLGLAGGLAFWTLGMAGIYLLTVGVLGLWKFRVKTIPFYFLAGLGFLIGSLPWWMENITNDWAALQVLTASSALNPIPTTPAGRFLGLLLLGVPAVIGARYPWMPAYSPWFVGLPLLLVVLAAALSVVAVNRRKLLQSAPGGWLTVGLMTLIFFGVFVGTRFGVDSTGRYLLPLYLPLAISLGVLIWVVWQRKPAAAIGLLAAILLINGFENARAATLPDKITTQFDPITRFDNQHDEALIAFLREQGELRGYTTSRVAFRLAFLTDEELIFAPRLPYKADLSYSPNDNRYPAYDALAAESQKAAYITSVHPELDAVLRQQFTALGVTYQEQQIGEFHIFYDFSRVVRPDELEILNIAEDL